MAEEGMTAVTGVRLALSEVKDISQVEMDSIVGARAGGSFTSLEDLWRRTELSRPVLGHLVHLGACDGISGGRTRRELLWRSADLAVRPRHKAGDQLSLSFEDGAISDLPGLPAYTDSEVTEAELEITGIDGRRHLMDLYTPLMKELGCTSAADLRHKRNDSEVWVAGVKVSSQTPQIRSGQRIIFVTIDDLTGPLDVTVFERVQPWCAAIVFHSWILLFRGVVRKRGGASRIYRTDAKNVGVTVVVEEAFDLAEIAKDRATGMSAAEAVGRQRAREDRRTGVPAPRRLWHSSGGSAGG